MADNRGILTVAELKDGAIAPISYEELGIGRKLAKDTGQELSAALLGGPGAGAKANDLIAHGADKVYVVEHDLLKDHASDAVISALKQVIEHAKPGIVMLGQTDAGREVAPKLAFRLKAGICADCVELKADPATKAVVATRSVYGGNARADFIIESSPQVYTIRAKAFDKAERQDGHQGKIEQVKVNLDPSVIKIKLIERKKAEAKGVRLEDADVVVSGGRGLGGPEHFKQLEELAKLLKGAVGASRAVCDAGWMPPTMQVGLTGKVVSPSLYIAIAISGASQHMAGCAGSKVIVAINKDAEANMFKEAQFGVVGDYLEVLPAFIDTVRELVGS